jgi:hypothetical protein
MSVSPFVWAYVLTLSERNGFSRTPEHVSDALAGPSRTDAYGLGFWAALGDSGPSCWQENSTHER